MEPGSGKLAELLSQGMAQTCDINLSSSTLRPSTLDTLSAWQERLNFRYVSIAMIDRRFAESRDDEMQAQQADNISQSISCKFCSRVFTRPSAYAHHLESGVHSEMSRHHVTEAVRMLGIIPQITVSPTIGFTTTPSPSEIKVDHPQDSLREDRLVVSGKVFDSLNLSLLVSKPIVLYVPGDFTHLCFPYTRPICVDTFRSVGSLVAHMNSPVHDPKKFLCPKCERQFVVLSALIQHLESGRCGLASMKEVLERFAQVVGAPRNILSTSHKALLTT